ncbi:hypothetical protein [Paenibacillus lignilyticus]|uniref:DUF3139 domain-containing protein n=1 Tax=Paenibacillus lignilyticus TaxID=1172615 RepID=A0ABS5CCY1_9BACL|nr:hypothetical protein [Paenibacillus lignilyticus]MBP3963816.1 hypothetical protein [Paenibacillus lignilyticus]
MKLSRLLLILILVLTLGVITYFTYPLKIQNILPISDNIQNIHVTYITNGQFFEYNFNNKQEIIDNKKQLVKILDSTFFRRRVNSFKGGVADVIMIVIIYKDKEGNNRSYFIDYRQSGAFMVDKKDYQIYGKTKLTFDKLVEWFKKEGTLLKAL